MWLMWRCNVLEVRLRRGVFLQEEMSYVFGDDSGGDRKAGKLFSSVGTLGLDELSGVQCPGRQWQVMHCRPYAAEPDMHTVL